MSEPRSGLLFDTGALIDLYRGRPALRSRFEAVLAGTLSGYISAITEAELWRGIKSHEIERHEALLSHFRSLAPDSSAARLAGEWMQRYEPQGLGWMDALIVATAKRADLPLLTRDAKLARVLSSEAQFQLYQP